MAETRRCPQCGGALSADAPEGLCPRCLLKEGVQSTLAADAPSGRTPSAVRFIPPEPAEIAEHFPQLEVIDLLGQGGMGVVYKARQPGLDRLVALKILPPDIGADPSFAERFAREARSLARLNHPNIVAVYDFGLAGGFFYFLMEYVDGVSLRQMERAERVSPKQALAIVPQICEALQYAHDEGIVHRDIKPENILIDTKGRVKIADFGLAKLLARGPTEYTLTQPQQMMGTIHYMAPEQMERPGEVDHRADIYSLGVVFYEMLTGELPLGSFVPPSRKVRVDVRLDEVVLRAMAREPERRYQRVSEVRTDVESIARQPGPAFAPPPAPPARAVPPAAPQQAAVAWAPAAEGQADNERNRWLGRTRVGALVTALGLLGFVVFDLGLRLLLPHLAPSLAALSAAQFLRVLPAVVWVVGVWVFTSWPADTAVRMLSPTARAAARWGSLVAVLLYVPGLLAFRFLPTSLFAALFGTVFVAAWAVPQFALFHYARRLYGHLGRPNLAAQAGVLTWLFPLVNSAPAVVMIAMGFAHLGDTGSMAEVRTMLLITAVLFWGVLAVQVWAAVVMLCYGLSKPDRPEPGPARLAPLPAAGPIQHADVRMARQRVQGPATGLLVVGLLNLLPLLAVPFLVLYGWRGGPAQQPRERIERFIPPERGAVLPRRPIGPSGPAGLSGHVVPRVPSASSPTAMPLAVVVESAGWSMVVLLGLFLYLPATILIILGAVKMRRLQSYGLAIIASILAMLPCTPFFLIGLPIGIWALVVLSRPEVKAAFAPGTGG